MKILLNIPEDLNLMLLKQVYELKAKGVKTNKTQLIEKLIRIGLKSEKL
ncbi:MAG: hypothetical protein WC139_13280 [Candidatus Kapaibacterium sp.]